jgi:hypothetical protein
MRRLERWATRLTENDSCPFDDLATTNELSDFRQPARKIPRSIHEGARDMARNIAATEAYATSRWNERRSRYCLRI